MKNDNQSVSANLENANFAQYFDNAFQKMDEIKKFSEDQIPEKIKNFNQESRVLEQETNNELEDNVEQETNNELEENVEQETNNELEENVEQAENKIIKTKKENAWQLKRKLYQANLEKRKLEEANKTLAENLNQVLDAGNYHYAKTVFNELDQAKNLLADAIKAGDEKAYVEAQTQLIEKQIAVNKLKEWEEQQKINNQNNASNDKLNEPLITQEEAESILYDFVEKHPYLNQSSKYFSSDMANQVGQYMEYLNSKLNEVGRKDLVFSPDYFDEVDQYIKNIKLKKTQNIKGYAPVHNVGKVNSARNIPNKPKQPILSKEEQEIADAFGATFGTTYEQYAANRKK